MTILAKIKNNSAVRLYSWLLSCGPEVELSAVEAAAQAGIKTRHSLIRARTELEALGVIRLGKRGRMLYATLLNAPVVREAVVQVASPREPTLEERADGIDQMPDDGGRKKGSNHMCKLDAQYQFLREVYGQKFADHQKKSPVSDASIRKWLDADPSCYYILLAVEDAVLRHVTRGDVSSPAAYIARMASINRAKRERGETAQRWRQPAIPTAPASTERPTPIAKPEPSLAEREQLDAAHYRRYMEDHERLKAMLLRGELKPVRPSWQLPPDYRPEGREGV